MKYRSELLYEYAKEHIRDQDVPPVFVPSYNRAYGCSQWLSIEWKEKRKFPVFNLIHKNSPVPRIKLSVKDIERIMNEHCS